MSDDTKAIEDAWYAERVARVPADKTLQAALVPPGGNWRCIAEQGATTRSIVWNEMEVALVNPRGDFLDHLEGELAMGIRATPIMDKALRVIFVLARDPANLDLIGRIARAAIDYVEQPAPAMPEPDEEEEDEPLRDAVPR